MFDKNDIEAIKKYNEQIDNCVTSQTAFNRTMLNASEDAQELVAAANGNVISLDKLTKSSKAAELAMKGLALAGNIFVSLVISKVISTVYEMAQASDTVGKAAKEAADELITQRQNSVQFSKSITFLHFTPQNCGATLFKSRIFRH